MFTTATRAATQIAALKRENYWASAGSFQGIDGRGRGRPYCNTFLPVAIVIVASIAVVGKHFRREDVVFGRP